MTKTVHAGVRVYGRTTHGVTMRFPTRLLAGALVAAGLLPRQADARQLPAAAGAEQGVNQELAAQYFREAAMLCERDGGRLWGVSLCGPIVFADAPTQTIATNQPPPDAPRPRMLGYANTALDWGGTRWTTVVWRYLPADDSAARGRLMVHELFHRVQPQLALFLNEPNNEHLETLDGRYWLQLEWRALEAALAASGPARDAAIRDALAFRAARHARFDAAAENERVLEINEGLAQYTGTVVGTATPAEAVADAIDQLRRAPARPTFVREFAYPSGAAWGVLLDAYAPGWPRRLKPTDDLARLLASAAGMEPTPDAEAAARTYDGAELRASEERLEAQRQATIAAYRRRFVEGPVLVIPAARSASFLTTGMTSIPGAGLVYPSYRGSGPWGSLEGALVLVSRERGTLTVPGPFGTEGATIRGENWTLTLEPGWVIRPGSRAGDFEVVHQAPPPGSPR